MLVSRCPPRPIPGTVAVWFAKRRFVVALHANQNRISPFMKRNRARRKLSRSKRRRRPPGSPPGPVVHVSTERQPHITVVSYDENSISFRENATYEEALQLQEGRRVHWVNIEGIASSELVDRLGAQFNLHMLSLEDATTTHQRIKAETYKDNLFVVLRVPIDEHGYETEQLNMFVGNGFVITMHDNPVGLVAALSSRLKDERSKLRASHAGFLAYAILDFVIDRYFPVVEQFAEELDAIEDRISHNPPREIMHEVHDIRVALRSVRRIAWQFRDATNVLQRDESGRFSASTKTFLRDCHDHTIQLIELLEIAHETCSDLRDIYLSEVSNRLNEVMMVLTIIATIFIPLSFIAGLYGMNFQPSASPWNMPELNWYFGYPFAIALMISTAVGMMLFFRRLGWVGGRGSDLDQMTSHREAMEAKD